MQRNEPTEMRRRRLRLIARMDQAGEQLAAVTQRSADTVRRIEREKVAARIARLDEASARFRVIAKRDGTR
jgi:hypothetical protein